jgi:DNA-directed RNA polymerase specialized sigma24 family protein
MEAWHHVRPATVAAGTPSARTGGDGPDLLGSYVERHHEHLRRLAALICRDDREADEVAAVALAQGWQRRDEMGFGADDTDRLEGLLVREAITRDRRRRLPWARLLARPTPIPADLIEGRLAVVPGLAGVRFAYSELNVADRAVLALRVHHGRTDEQVAALLGGSPRAVRARIQRAMGRVAGAEGGDVGQWRLRQMLEIRDTAVLVGMEDRSATDALARVRACLARPGARHAWPWPLVPVLVLGLALLASDLPARRTEPSPSALPTAPVAAPSFPARLAVPGMGPYLRWARLDVDAPWPVVAWAGDRFVLVDTRSGALWTSPDGLAWSQLPAQATFGTGDFMFGQGTGRIAAFGATIIGFADATRSLVMVDERAVAWTATFEDQIEAAAIGPAGIVVAESSGTWSEQPQTRVRWSRDGQAWSDGWSVDGHVALAVVRDGFLAIVTAPDGRSARADWSADGLAWREVGPTLAPVTPLLVASWADGAVVVDAEGAMDCVTSAGIAPVPFATELPSPEPSTERDSWWGWPGWQVVGGGGAGIFLAGTLPHPDADEPWREPSVVFSPNGVDWSSAVSPVGSGDPWGWGFGPQDVSVAVSGDVVLMAAEGQGLWRATVSPWP